MANGKMRKKLKKLKIQKSLPSPRLGLLLRLSISHPSAPTTPSLFLLPLAFSLSLCSLLSAPLRSRSYI